MKLSRFFPLALPTLLSIALLASAAAADAPADSPDQVSYWLSRATTEAAGLTDPAEKAAVLTAISQHWLAAGDTAQAKAVADQALPEAQDIQDAQIQFRVMLNLVALLDQSGDSQGAQSALAAAQAASDALPAGHAKDADAAQLAAARSRIGGFAAARRPIDELSDPAARTSAFCALAEQFSKSGQSADAAQAVKAAIASLPANPDEVRELQPLIASTQADIGDTAGAAQTVSQMTDPLDQANAYLTLADAYIHDGQTDQARDAIARADAAAAAVSDENKPPILLHVARDLLALNDPAGAAKAVDAAVDSANLLSPLDRTFALAAAARERSELGDKTSAALLASDAATAAQSITNPGDQAQALMAVAAAQARSGQGAAAMQTVASAEALASQIPAANLPPQGLPTPDAYMDVVLGLSAVADYPDAQAIAAKISDPDLRRQAMLQVASAEVDDAQYQAAEDTAAHEGSVEAQADVCGMIASSLARTRNVTDASKWTELLHNNSDKIAARLAVASFLEQKQATSTRPS
ncbi:MAG TPA: hypothetical protein VMD30_04920 [Tepidisphaeraceae bacterium]|nr:hypothetical protein [Tepidisphaeraceae bacterium]